MKTTSLIATIVLSVSSLVGCERNALAQTAQEKALDEMKRLSAMTPQQLDAYKKAQIQKAKQKYAETGATVLDMPFEEGLYGSTIPAKNIKALTKAESIVTDQQTLLNLLNRMSAALQLRLVPSVKTEVLQTLQNQPAPLLASYAASLWYTGRQEAALLMMIGAVQKEPANALFWNNLGAFCNLSGLEGVAIPVMKYCLKLSPNSSMAYNNLGQAYLGLGNQSLSREALLQCLQLDSLNPEANRSMAVLSLETGNNAEAVQYFSRELKVAYRETSIQLIKNAGLEEQIPYANLLLQGSARNFSLSAETVSIVDPSAAPTKGPAMDVSTMFEYEENTAQTISASAYNGLSLSRVQMPPIPKNWLQVENYHAARLGFKQKIVAEMEYFAYRATLTEKERQGMRYKAFMYDNWATAVIQDLMMHEFPQLQFNTQDWVNYKKEWALKYFEAIEEVEKHGSWKTNEERCEQLRKVSNHYISLYGGYLENRHQVLQTRWKIFIDHIGEIVGMAPSHASTLYSMTMYYLAYLGAVSEEADMQLYGQCTRLIDVPEAAGWDLNHLFEVVCQKGIGGSLPLGIIKAKLDCEGLSFSGSAELLKFGIEKKFKTGTSTAWISGGLDASYKDIFQVEATEKLFVVWDKNNVCTDAGVSGTGKIAIEKVGSSEFGYSFGVSSGFEAGFTNENELSGNLNKALSFL